MYRLKHAGWIVRMIAVVALGLFLSACSKPQVFLFARYLGEQERELVEQKLSQSGFRVTSNKHRFPVNTAYSSLVYSVNAEQGKIDEILQQLAGLDYSEVKSGLYVVGGKQYFTRDSFGLYLFSNRTQLGLEQRTELVNNDIPMQIEAVHSCHLSVSIHLNENNQLRLDVMQWDDSKDDYQVESQAGTWYLKEDLLNIELATGVSQRYSRTREKRRAGQYINHYTRFVPQLAEIEEASPLACQYESNLLELISGP